MVRSRLEEELLLRLLLLLLLLGVTVAFSINNSPLVGLLVPPWSVATLVELLGSLGVELFSSRTEDAILVEVVAVLMEFARFVEVIGFAVTIGSIIIPLIAISSPSSIAPSIALTLRTLVATIIAIVIVSLPLILLIVVGVVFLLAVVVPISREVIKELHPGPSIGTIILGIKGVLT